METLQWISTYMYVVVKDEGMPSNSWEGGGKGCQGAPGGEGTTTRWFALKTDDCTLLPVHDRFVSSSVGGTLN